jgi:hypothetical protein
MTEDRGPIPVSGMGGGFQAVLFLVTAPVMGWMAGMAWVVFTTMGFIREVMGPYDYMGVVIGVALCVLPVLWIIMLATAWRDLGRHRFWLVRNSPLALAGVFILTAIAVATA